MANEIGFTAKLTVQKSGVTVTQQTSTKTQSMATALTKLHHTVQSVGTSEESVSVGDVDISNATGDQYLVLFYNRNATNYVEVSVKYAATPSYWVIGVMRPGEPWGPARIPKLDGSSLGGLFLKANTAACDVEVTVCEAGTPP